MRRSISGLILALSSTGALAQAVDCSAFEHKKDGSWVVVKETRLTDLKDGVSKSVGLAPGLTFSRDGNATMGGVKVFDQVEAACK